MSRFTPDRLRAEADAVEEDRHIWRSVGRMLAAMLRQAAEDAEDVAAWRKLYTDTLAERAEARAIARRWHETVREMDGEFYSLKSQALHELLADAATIAGWSKDNAPAVAKPSTEGAE